MNLPALVLLAVVPVASAGDLDDAHDNLDTVVRGYVAQRSEDGVWTLPARGAGKPLRLRYDGIERDTAHSTAPGRWTVLADFTSIDTKKKYVAETSAKIGGDLWEVKSMYWKSSAQAAALRKTSAVAAAAPAPKRAAPGPLPALLVANQAANYDPSRNARADIAAACAEASKSGRRVLLEVGSGGCSWCARMHDFVAKDAEIKTMKEERFVTVLADLRANGPLWKEYGPVPGTPHLFVLGPDGAVLHSQDTEQLEKGSSYDREKYVAFLNDWSPSGD